MGYFNARANTLDTCMLTEQINTTSMQHVIFFLQRRAISLLHHAPMKAGSRCWKVAFRSSFMLCRIMPRIVSSRPGIDRNVVQRYEYKHEREREMQATGKSWCAETRLASQKSAKYHYLRLRYVTTKNVTYERSDASVGRCTFRAVRALLRKN